MEHTQFSKESTGEKSLIGTMLAHHVKIHFIYIGLFIDIRSMRDNELHGSGLRLVNTKGEVQLSIKRTASGSANVKCHIFILSDAQFNIVNRELESVTC